jgi:isopentenyl diphosphate isomerase/L-lactate dehydrogenase-like FMN-dependent dehydrogenase
MSSQRRAARAVNIEDLRKLARRKLPRVVFDYLDGGADAEVTLGDNRRSWDHVLFRPRQAVRLPKVDTRTTVLGCDLAVPFLLAPVGYTRIMHRDAEAGVARAAHAAGAGYVLTTFSGTRVEDVGAAGGPLWYQLYLAGGQAVVEPALARAWAAGARVLAVTIDTNWPGMRERDVRNGIAQLVGGKLLDKVPYLPQMLARPRWLAGYLADLPDVMRYPNVVLPGIGPAPAKDVGTMLRASIVDWSDLPWIRAAWPGPIVMKGVLSGDDAKRSVDEGAAGVIVSNHGGRQLDTCYPTARALPEVVRAVGGQVPVLVDGGIRRGGDIAKAICMGASAVLVGRAYAYGLGAAGEAGVARAIAILREDFERTLRLLGCASVRELNGSYVDVPAAWQI